VTTFPAGAKLSRAWRRLRSGVRRMQTGGAGNGSDSEKGLSSLILATPPIATEVLTESVSPSHPIGVHILGQDAHLELALWALKSFYRFAGDNLPLTVHLQGQNTRKVREVLGQHFPQARLVSQEEADAVVEPWLEKRGLRRLLVMRRQIFLMMKLVDLRLFARTPFVVSFDTDVLFFQRPTSLLALTRDDRDASSLFMRDCCPSYCITPERARADLGIELMPFANSGLMRLATESIDLETCDRYLAHPDLAQPHWHLEQTLHALNASAQNRVRLLPDEYLLAEGPYPQPEQLVARHYASPMRPLFAAEGIPTLLNMGILEAGAAGGASDGSPQHSGNKTQRP
jgi:hypothetical protein